MKSVGASIFTSAAETVPKTQKLSVRGQETLTAVYGRMSVDPSSIRTYEIRVTNCRAHYTSANTRDSHGNAGNMYNVKMYVVSTEGSNVREYNKHTL